MKTRLMAALAAVALLLMTMPGLVAAGKPMPVLETLSLVELDCDGQGNDSVQLVAEWSGANGKWVSIAYDYSVRGGEGPVSVVGRFENDGASVIHTFDYAAAGNPGIEFHAEGSLARPSGKPISDSTDTGWFGCPST